MPISIRPQPSKTGTETRRLVVLIPNQDVEEVKLSRAIRAIPCPSYVNVLLVAVVQDEEQELASRRRMATIATYVRDSQYTVSFQACWQHSWHKALKELVQPGDVLVYPPELSIRTRAFHHIPLEKALQGLNLPLYPLAGFFQESQRTWPRRLLLRAGYWSVLALILVVFFNLESAASLAISGSLSHLVTILVMLIEFGAVYLWTAIAG